MGPRLVSRGKTNRMVKITGNPEALQWGRDLLVAESPRRLYLWVSVAVRLQWGRDLLVAESPRLRSKLNEPTGFNGAATC